MTDTALTEDVPLPGMPEPQKLVPAATDPRIPANLEGCGIHFGIPVCSNEDDDMFAFGHHAPKQALAAMNAYAKSLGFMDLLDGGKHDMSGWKTALENIKTCWAVPQLACDEHASAGKRVDGCGECAEISDGTFVVDDDADENTEGAFPVMVWTA